LVLSEEKQVMPGFASSCFTVLSLANIGKRKKIFSQAPANGEDGFVISSLVASLFSVCLMKL